MRISDWSSDVCSSDLLGRAGDHPAELAIVARAPFGKPRILDFELADVKGAGDDQTQLVDVDRLLIEIPSAARDRGQRARALAMPRHDDDLRPEEHTSELPSLMRISYDVFCLKN